MDEKLSEHERITRVEKKLKLLNDARACEHADKNKNENKQNHNSGTDEPMPEERHNAVDLGSDKPVKNERNKGGASGTRLKRNGEGDDGNEVDKDDNAGGGSEVVFTEPVHFHSVTRRDCKFVLTGRQTVQRTIVDATGLSFRHRSWQYESKQSVQSQLETVLQMGLSEEISNEVSFGNFNANATASMSAEERRQTVEQFLSSVSVIIIHHILSVEGTLKIKKRLDITDVWAWDGKDCPQPLPPAEAFSYQLEGRAIRVGISNEYHYWDMYAPALGPGMTRDEATRRARSDMTRDLRNSVALPEPPFPSGGPVPLNF